ncbi:hypothetical protein [Pseudomonas sp. RT6P73]
MDKAISWPLGQENRKSLVAEALRTGPRHFSNPDQALLGGKVFDQALILLAGNWSKNEQHAATYAGYRAAPAMNGLSTGCSTVFVRKPKARA